MRQFPKLLTMSREEAESFVAGSNDICISIRCSATADPAPISANYRAVLRLVFDDIPWTDAPCPDNAVQITDAIADNVVRFVSANPDAMRLVIHCVAGASRSVSMAMALAQCFTGEAWRPRWLIGHDLRGRPAPNPNVYHAIVAAYARRFPKIPVLREAVNVEDLKQRDQLVRRMRRIRARAVSDKAEYEQWNAAHPTETQISTALETAMIAWCDGKGPMPSAYMVEAQAEAI